MNEEVLPNACSVDTDVFRERLASDAVQNVFAAHKRNMKIIYTEFAADDESDEGVSQRWKGIRVPLPARGSAASRFCFSQKWC